MTQPLLLDVTPSTNTDLSSTFSQLATDVQIFRLVTALQVCPAACFRRASSSCYFVVEQLTNVCSKGLK